MNNIIIEFDLDYLKILEEDSDVSIAQLDLLHLGVNRNKCNISKECVNKSLPTFFNKPIIYRLNNKFAPSESTDVVEHARTEEQEKTTYIGGTIPESSPTEFVERDGRTYLRMVGVIHKLYQPTLYNILKKRKGEVKVSIELKVIDGYQDENGILVINEFKFLSVCLLGEGITEGIIGSNLLVTKFSISDYNQHYLSFANENKYLIPKEVKTNVQKGLELRKQFGRGGTSVSINTAKFILDNEYISYSKIKDLSEYFSKHQYDNVEPNDNPDNKYITFMLYGANESKLWSENILNNRKIEGDKLENTTEIFISKDLLGSKPAIKINKSKDAISEGEWSDNGIRKECLMADNWKTLCKAVFMKLEDGWEDGKEGSLGYPVMEKNGEEVVYNRKGLASARAYAVKNNEEDILSKLKSIYKHLGITWDDEKDNSKEGENMAENIKNSEEEEVIDNASEKEEDGKSEPEAPETDGKVENAVDKTDWKQKYSDLEQKYSELEKECKMAKDKVAEFTKKEEEEKMCNLLSEFAHCYTEAELNEVKNSLDTMTYADLDEAVGKKAKEFALKCKKVEPEKEDKEEDKKEDSKEEKVNNAFKFSVSPFGIPASYDFSNKLGDGLQSIIKNSGVKIK